MRNSRDWVTFKALSVRQPWANFIASGSKTIEKRTWRTHYRGPVLIVSSRSPKRPPPAGYAVAIAEIVDCRPMKRADARATGSPFVPGVYAWVLRNIRKVRPVSVTGRLGLYTVRLRSAVVRRATSSPHIARESG